MWKFVFILIPLCLMGCEKPSSHHAFRLKPGQDLKIALDQYVREHHIKAAAIVTTVGSLSTVSMRYANQSDNTVLNGFFEIVSLTGTLGEKSGSHIHMAVADSKGQTYGGHLKEGSQIFTTAEIVLVNLKNLEFDREIDSATGFKELTIHEL